MEKKKLILKKQIIAELSDHEKRNILGGAKETDPGLPGATQVNSCIDCPSAMNVCWPSDGPECATLTPPA